MSKIKEGMNVIFIKNSSIVKGVAETVYDSIDLAIVALDDGTRVKRNLFDLVIDEKKTEEPEKPKEPVEKSEITITTDEFRKKASTLIAKLAHEGATEGMLVLAFTLFVYQLHEVLFFEAEE